VETPISHGDVTTCEEEERRAARKSLSRRLLERLKRAA
jgi:hypothetical protein